MVNLVVQKRSRRSPVSGDIFAVQPPDGQFLYGRVIATDVDAGGFPGSNLIYIYRMRSRVKTLVPPLHRNELLIPPIMTNNLPWTRGYFELIENKRLVPEDVLQEHCFKDTRGWYFDEYGRRLSGPVGFVGECVLHSFRTIDDAISKALGISLAP